MECGDHFRSSIAIPTCDRFAGENRGCVGESACFPPGESRRWRAVLGGVGMVETGWQLGEFQADAPSCASGEQSDTPRIGLSVAGRAIRAGSTTKTGVFVHGGEATRRHHARENATGHANRPGGEGGNACSRFIQRPPHQCGLQNSWFLCPLLSRSGVDFLRMEAAVGQRVWRIGVSSGHGE